MPVRFHTAGKTAIMRDAGGACVVQVHFAVLAGNGQIGVGELQTPARHTEQRES